MTDFANFWAAYPRKVGKAEAIEAYAKALKGQLRRQLACGLGKATHEEIMAGLDRYKRDKPDYADWKHGSTFLNKVSWIDEGGSEVIEPERDNTAELAMQRREHEDGRYAMYSLAKKHGWGEFGSTAIAHHIARPISDRLKVVK